MRSLPIRWTLQELEAQRLTALRLFVEERLRPPQSEYRACFQRRYELLDRLFATTDDLLAFTPAGLNDDPRLLDAARFLAAPPWSQADLRTVVGADVVKRKRLSQEELAQAVQALQIGWDPHRFPWVTQSRRPTPQERESALRWTASVWAIEATRTRRRMKSSRRQQQAVEEALQRAGYTKAELKKIDFPHHLPVRQFTSEALVRGAKCDVPVRLHDERLLTIECKVSSDATNSVKRLIRDTGGKAQRWREAFGELVVPAVVLAGVFKLSNLREAQDIYGLTLFWEHDLATLEKVVGGA